QDVGRDALLGGQDLAVVRLVAKQQIAHDQQRPLVTEDVQRRTDRAVRARLGPLHPATNERACSARCGHCSPASAKTAAQVALVRPWPGSKRSACPAAISSSIRAAGILTTSVPRQGNMKTLPPTHSAVVPNIFFCVIDASPSRAVRWDW